MTPYAWMAVTLLFGYLCGRWAGVIHERDTLRRLAKMRDDGRVKIYGVVVDKNVDEDGEYAVIEVSKP